MPARALCSILVPPLVSSACLPRLFSASLVADGECNSSCLASHLDNTHRMLLPLKSDAHLETLQESSSLPKIALVSVDFPGKHCISSIRACCRVRQTTNNRFWSFTLSHTQANY